MYVCVRACVQCLCAHDPVIARQHLHQFCETGSVNVELQAHCRYHTLRHCVPNRTKWTKCGISRFSVHVCKSLMYCVTAAVTELRLTAL